MIRRALFLGMFASVSLACGGDEKALPQVPPPSMMPSAPRASVAVVDAGATENRFDAALFRTAINEAIESYLAGNPVDASKLGDHRFDDRWPDMSAQGEGTLAADFRVRAQGLRTIAASVPPSTTAMESGSDHPELDALVLADQLDGDAFALTGLHKAERDPSAVVSEIGGGITALTSHEFASKHTRMNALATRLAAVPALLKTARLRVQKPMRASLEVLSPMTKGLGLTLRGSIAKIDAKELDGDVPLKTRLAKSALDAAAALDAYSADISGAFPVASAKDDPIGAEAWSTMARLHEGVLDPPADIRKMGEAEIARLDVDLDALIAKSGQPKETRAAFFTRLEKDVASPDKVLDEYRASIQRLDEWLHGHPFATIPWEMVKLEVVPSPPEQKYTSFASMNSAGVLETKSSDANFQVTAPDATMTEAKKKALLAFHARGAIDLVTIHEAIPGHDLQFLIQRQTPSKVRKIVWTSTLGEGWAHYCEQAVLEGGFSGADPVRTKAFYLRMALQRAARVVIDVGENDGSLSVDAAAKFLSETAFLAPDAAKMEAFRAVLSPANMFAYTYGKLSILKLRERVKASEGDKFDLVRFHDRLLAFGAIPVRYAGKGAFGLE
jgi:uncharacterized protein (DUF885 family)